MKTPMQKANVELRIQTRSFLIATCQKNRNKNQSQLQREGLIQNRYWKTEFAKTLGNWSPGDVHSSAEDLIFMDIFPSGHGALFVSGQTYWQACGSCRMPHPSAWRKKHFTAPAILPPKLTGLRLHFDFSLLGVGLKTPLVLARKLEEIQCNRGERTSYSRPSRRHSGMCFSLLLLST